jgi:hypothetical protein
MSKREQTLTLYVKLTIAVFDFFAILGFGYLEVNTTATVPWWFMAALLSILGATLGINIVKRATGASPPMPDPPGVGPGDQRRQAHRNERSQERRGRVDEHNDR